MPSKIINELVQSEEEIRADIDILIATDKTILLLVQQLRDQIVDCKAEVESLREELNELYRLIKEISVDASINSVDDLDEYVRARTDKTLN